VATLVSVRTPSHRTTLWLAANVLWFSSIPALGSFLVRELKSGAFPTDGDSIGIPLFGWVSVTVVLAPVLNTAWWWLSRNYPGSVFLFAMVFNGKTAGLYTMTQHSTRPDSRTDLLHGTLDMLILQAVSDTVRPQCLYSLATTFHRPCEATFHQVQAWHTRRKA
jgi:hypothetical protein